MRDNDKARQLTSVGATAKGRFALSQKSQAHIMQILRDTLYSDRILAVLREYASNAWDAHRTAGKGTVPIKVTLPTIIEPTLRIRDYGSGLSLDDVLHLYTQYGESTKRETDDVVGNLGLGCKSAFSYSDTFTITSWHGGFKRVFVAVLDPSNVGEIQCMDEAECKDPTETGLEIQVPIKAVDIDAFRTRAERLFCFFDPQPEINCELKKIDRGTNNNGFLEHNTSYSATSGWVAIMGCVPYRVDLQQLRNELSDLNFWSALTYSNICGGLYFGIGDLTIAASREELKYTDRTKTALVTKIRTLVADLQADVLAVVQDPLATEWEKRLKVATNVDILNLGRGNIPTELKPWASAHVDLWSSYSQASPPQTFILHRSGCGDSCVNSIAVSPASKIVICDDPRNHKGFDLPRNSYVAVQRLKTVSVEAMQQELTEYLGNVGLTGIPVELISTLNLYWSSIYKGSRQSQRSNASSNNPVYHTQTFVLEQPGTHHRFTKDSDNWHPHKWEATDDDVYLILQYFHPLTPSQTEDCYFYDNLRKDLKFYQQFGITLPTIYGYKTSEKRPVDISKVKGISYYTWRERATNQAAQINPLLREFFRALQVQQLVDAGCPLASYEVREVTTLIQLARHNLGLNHPLAQILTEYEEANTKLQKQEYLMPPLRAVYQTSKFQDPDLTAKGQMIQERYPLFFLQNLFAVAHSNPEKWLGYVLMADKAFLYDDLIKLYDDRVKVASPKEDRLVSVPLA